MKTISFTRLVSGKAKAQLYISSELHTRRNSTSGFYFPKSCCQTEMKLTCAENKSTVGSVFRFEAGIYLDFLFSLCGLHPGRHAVCNTLPPALSQGSGREAKSAEREIVYAHARQSCICVSACLCAYVYSV